MRTRINRQVITIAAGTKTARYQVFKLFATDTQGRRGELLGQYASRAGAALAQDRIEAGTQYIGHSTVG